MTDSLLKLLIGSPAPCPLDLSTSRHSIHDLLETISQPMHLSRSASPTQICGFGAVSRDSGLGFQEDSSETISRTRVPSMHSLSRSEHSKCDRWGDRNALGDARNDRESCFKKDWFARDPDKGTSCWDCSHPRGICQERGNRNRAARYPWECHDQIEPCSLCDFGVCPLFLADGMLVSYRSPCRKQGTHELNKPNRRKPCFIYSNIN